MKTLLRSTADLATLAPALGPTADVSRLAAYLRVREAGVRSRMAEPLSAFAAEAAGWAFDDRRAVVRWIGEPWIAAAGLEPTSSFTKRGDPVFRVVVSPTLAEWRAQDPDDPEPALLACLWDEPNAQGAVDRVGRLRTLLARHPDLPPARRALVRAVVDIIGFNQHEWPHGYLGSPTRDLAALADVGAWLEKTPCDAWRVRMASAVTAMCDLAHAAEARSGRRVADVETRSRSRDGG